MESSEPKKYPPTKKKLNDLRKKGQFPKTEFVEPIFNILALIVFVLVFFILVFDHFNLAFALAGGDAKVEINEILTYLMMAIGITVFIKVLMMLGNWTVVNKSLVTFESLKPDLKKIHPKEGFKKIFAPSALGKSLIRIMEALILLFILKYFYDIRIINYDSYFQINNKSSLVYNLCISIVMVCVFYVGYGFIIGTIDFLVERALFINKNKMTYTEMKNDMKDTEGAPEIKNARKRMMREIMLGDSQPRLKNRKPNFAIANPTHLLIPIAYEAGVDQAPLILNVTKDRLALFNRNDYLKLGIPVIENVPLARKIYGKVGYGNTELPVEFWYDIAKIIKELQVRT